MAISTYAELQTEITSWLDRNDIQGQAATFIQLAEARLNRLIDPVGTTATLTGTIGNAFIDISSLGMTEPGDLWITLSGTERAVTPLALGTFPTTTEQGEPAYWAIEGGKITFERPCAEAYPFRFVYQGTLGLSDAVPTNNFLRTHPDLYLAASIYWGCVFVQAGALAGGYKGMWDEFLLEVRHQEAEKKRALLTVDPMLALVGSRYWSDR